MNPHLRLFAGVLLATLPLIVSATTVRWHLSGVTFDDGASASGWFEVDSATNKIGQFDITTTSGALIDGRAYRSDEGHEGRTVVTGQGTQRGFKQTESPYWRLHMTPIDELDGGGGVHALKAAYPAGNYECGNCSPSRYIVSGALEGNVDVIFADGFEF